MLTALKEAFSCFSHLLRRSKLITLTKSAHRWPFPVTTMVISSGLRDSRHRRKASSQVKHMEDSTTTRSRYSFG